MLIRDFTLKLSYFYLTAWVMFLLLSVSVILSLQAPALLKSLCLLGVMVYMFYIARRFIFLQDVKSVLALRYQHDATWLLRFKQSEQTAILLGSSTVTSKLAILRFKLSSQRLPMACIVFPDALPAGEYRRLMMFAKLG